MQVTTIGIDLAKNVFQVHGVDATGKVTITKKLRRAQMLPLFERLPPCLVGMERAPHHTTGRASSELSGTMCG